MVGDRIGAGALDLAEEETAKTTVALKLAFLLVVDVEKIKFTGAVRELPRNVLEQTAHHGFPKGIEEEEQAGALGERKLDGVATTDLHGDDASSALPPDAHVAAGDAGESCMQLDPDDFVERHFRGEKNGAAHACADVDEGEFLDGRGWFCSLPTFQKSVKDGGRDAVVGRGVAIVTMAAFEVATGDQAAGADTVGCVERMAHEAVGHGESGKQTALGRDGHDCTVAQGVCVLSVIARRGWGRRLLRG